jgi:hypothetical protein
MSMTRRKKCLVGDNKSELIALTHIFDTARLLSHCGNLYACTMMKLIVSTSPNWAALGAERRVCCKPILIPYVLLSHWRNLDACTMVKPIVVMYIELVIEV